MDRLPGPPVADDNFCLLEAVSLFQLFHHREGRGASEQHHHGGRKSSAAGLRHRLGVVCHWDTVLFPQILLQSSREECFRLG